MRKAPLQGCFFHAQNHEGGKRYACRNEKIKQKGSQRGIEP